MDKQRINEVFGIINRSILSSRSLLQMESAERMVDLFRKQNVSPELNEKIELIFIREAQKMHYFEWKKFREFGTDAA